MTEYQAVPAVEAHALALAKVMRWEDRREVYAGSHMTPKQALLMAVKTTERPIAWLADGQVMYMCGVRGYGMPEGNGVIWGLGSKNLTKHTIPFLRFSKQFIKEIWPHYDVLLNYVDARHILAVRWLAWLGFDVQPSEPQGPDNMMFHLFYMQRA
jgi:hypothetical protein